MTTLSAIWTVTYFFPPSSLSLTLVFATRELAAYFDGFGAPDEILDHGDTDVSYLGDRITDVGVNELGNIYMKFDGDGKDNIYVC
ncbi:hypothetical protein SISSUDRAFT_1062486 [Sistotremastrum suecicum HHB10207 ss-3]|uniref:Uncharacterized protein n=1 Tax=Sistotremastrum suecicum HHB10207 ss-3 TaxID=1314776 RepID=A0A166CU64_9AGAM|nr:hypothetical protein SISSUDRAFT_1062486 [Sistotremastrum suecicum HHB10207 ss-3]